MQKSSQVVVICMRMTKTQTPLNVSYTFEYLSEIIVNLFNDLESRSAIVYIFNEGNNSWPST